MDGLIVKASDREYRLEPSHTLTFGRDALCTICLGSTDTGVSRVAGSIGSDGGTWWIVNRSTSRILQVVDQTGISRPIPVAVASGEPSRRAVDRRCLTVIVAGNVLTHAIDITALGTPAVQTVADSKDPKLTGELPNLSDKQREALVALFSGFLRPFPRYEPHPLSYEAAGQMLGETGTAVRRRVESLRRTLIDTGIPGLQGKEDARPALAEWVLSMQLVTPEDLDWLEKRLAQRRPLPED